MTVVLGERKSTENIIGNSLSFLSKHSLSGTKMYPQLRFTPGCIVKLFHKRAVKELVM